MPRCRGFLKELDVDYIDLLLVHWPNPEVNLADTLRTMVVWKERGLIRHVGVSNFVRFHLDAFAEEFPILTNQIEVHPYLQRGLLVKKCKEMRVIVTAYRPLAKGAFEQDPVMQAIGAQYGKSPSQLALRWLVQQGIPVIPKAATIKHLKDNLNIFDFSLDKQDLTLIHSLDAGRRFCAPDDFPLYDD